MSNAVKTIGVLTSGGDAPGMNACLRAIVRSGLVQGLEIYAIKDGYRGLIDDDIEKMTRHSVSDILNRGGTCIGTARLPEFKNPEVQKKGVEILKNHGIDALVAIGGDGTYQGAQALHKWGIHTIGIPGTIDNDVASSDFTIGFDTALNTIVECVDRLRDTSTSHQRCSVIEVMGHFCGDLSAYAGIACGSELTIINEQNISEDEIIENLKVEKAKGKRHAMVIISEKVLDVAGAGLANGTRVQQYASNYTDAQKWKIEKNQDGTVTSSIKDRKDTVPNHYHNRCLPDPSNNSTARWYVNAWKLIP